MNDESWEDFDTGPDWYFKVRGQPRRGPMSLATLTHLRKRGRLPDSALVWTEGMPAWDKCSTVLAQPHAPPTTAGTHTSTPSPAKAPAKPKGENRAARKTQSNAPRGGNSTTPVVVAQPETTQVSAAQLGLAVRRGLARWFDLALFALIVFINVFALADRGDARASDLLDRLDDSLAFLLGIVVVGWIPLEALLLALFGRTPGKWAFSLAVRGADGFVERLSQMGTRAARVAVWGLLLGIPILSLIAQFVAFVRLSAQGTTAWDAHCSTRVEAGVFDFRRIPTAIALSLVLCAASIAVVQMLLQSG